MTAQELSARAELDEELRQQATPEMPVRGYIEQLAGGERLREAVSVMAHALPKRDAIAWGLECVQRVEAASAKPKAGPALQAVDDWLAKPGEQPRRAAHEAAQQAGFGTPAGCLGLAVFMSGGSMAPAEAPVAPEPAPHVCGKLVAGAILMAAVSDPVNAAKHFRGFLDRGLQLADELKIWEE